MCVLQKRVLIHLKLRNYDLYHKDKKIISETREIVCHNIIM